MDLTTDSRGKRFENVAVRGEISKHYLTKWRILLYRTELDEWLIGR